MRSSRYCLPSRTTRRKALLASTAALAGWTLGPSARAQPATTTVWLGFPSGGLGDQVARPLLERMKGRYPSNIILDSKPGAGGRIAADFVKRASPDGANLLQCPSSTTTLYPHIYRSLTYDPRVDFVGVAPLVAYTITLTVGPAVPPEVRTVEDLVRWCKANPDLANYGIPAAGSSPHFAGMMLDRTSKLNARSVPYKGGAPLLQDLLGGQIPFSFNVVSEVLPHLQAGRLRALAVGSPQRWPALPEVPTMVEAGYKDIAIVEFLGWYAPAKTPAALVQRLNAAVQDSLLTPEMGDVLQRNGLLPLRESPEVFAARIRDDIARWGRIVQATGFTAEG